MNTPNCANTTSVARIVLLTTTGNLPIMIAISTSRSYVSNSLEYQRGEHSKLRNYDLGC